MELEKLINFYRYNMWNGTAGITHLLVNGEYGGFDELLSLIRERLVNPSDAISERTFATGDRPGNSGKI